MSVLFDGIRNLKCFSITWILKKKKILFWFHNVLLWHHTSLACSPMMSMFLKVIRGLNSLQWRDRSLKCSVTSCKLENVLLWHHRSLRMFCNVSVLQELIKYGIRLKHLLVTFRFRNELYNLYIRLSLYNSVPFFKMKYFTVHFNKEYHSLLLTWVCVVRDHKFQAHQRGGNTGTAPSTPWWITQLLIFSIFTDSHLSPNAMQLCLNVYNFTSSDSHGMSAAQSEVH